MKQAFVVGAKIHVDYRKHGIPSTDTNNIVLLVSASFANYILPEEWISYWN